MKPLFFAVIFAALPLAAHAQAENGRYQIMPVSGGIARLDTQTGAITLCRDEGGELFCTRAEDGTDADDSAVARLEDRVEALEKALKELKETKKPASAPLPDKAEIDRTFSIMEQMMRRFMGLAEELSRESPKNQTYPNRT